MRPKFHCSFCAKSEDDVRQLIAGPSVYICNECVDVCVVVIADDAQYRRRVDAGDRMPDEQRGHNQPFKRACALCGLPVSLDEAVSIKQRGFLCRECVDAVDTAIAKNRFRQ